MFELCDTKKSVMMLTMDDVTNLNEVVAVTNSLLEPLTECITQCGQAGNSAWSVDNYNETLGYECQTGKHGKRTQIVALATWLETFGTDELAIAFKACQTPLKTQSVDSDSLRRLFEETDAISCDTCSVRYMIWTTSRQQSEDYLAAVCSGCHALKYTTISLERWVTVANPANIRTLFKHALGELS